MRIALLAALAVLTVGCGGDAEPPGEAAASTERQEATTEEEGDAKETDGSSRERRDGTRIVVADSEFGRMLFDSKRQAIYIFERDRENRTVCYGECAEAWPPVLTRGEPVGGTGVETSLLGTLERRDGKLQVTYAGKPLYFYAHERPGEVRCHNVVLNGGFWWVVGPDGERLA